MNKEYGKDSKLNGIENAEANALMLELIAKAKVAAEGYTASKGTEEEFVTRVQINRYRFSEVFEKLMTSLKIEGREDKTSQAKNYRLITEDNAVEQAYKGLNRTEKMMLGALESEAASKAMTGEYFIDGIANRSAKAASTKMM